MPDFTVRSDSVNVEQIMEQVRAKIREKRGADPTEPQVLDVAAARLEALLDPKTSGSDLLHTLRARTSPPNTESGATEARRTPSRLRLFFRRILKRLLRPVAKILSEFNESDAIAREARDATNDRIFSHFAIELTRTAVELKKLRMDLESLSGRLEFNERRARALESALIYKPAGDDEPKASVGSPAAQGSFGSQGWTPSQGSHSSQGSQGSQNWRNSRSGQSAPVARGVESSRPTSPTSSDASPTPVTTPPEQAGEGQGQRSRRRRRRRGRRGGQGTLPPTTPGASTPLDQEATTGEAPESGHRSMTPDQSSGDENAAPGAVQDDDSSDDSDSGEL